MEGRTKSNREGTNNRGGGRGSRVKSSAVRAGSKEKERKISFVGKLAN